MDQCSGCNQAVGKRTWVWDMKVRCSNGDTFINRQNTPCECRNKRGVEPMSQDHTLLWVATFHPQNAFFDFMQRYR